MQRLLVTALLLTLSLAMLACERPPVGGAPQPPPEPGERVLLDLTAFLQDRPAIGGKRYDYSVDGHVLEPKSEAWVLKDADDAVFGFRISSVYDDDTGDTGLFTLEVVTRAATGWSASERFTAPANVKDGAPVCVSLSTRAGVACDDDGWHLRFALQSRLSVFAGFAVAEPAVFLNDGVVVARVDGLASLAELPDPAGLQVLDDAPQFETSDWDFARYASDLPAAGRVLGSVARASEGGWAFVDGRFHFVRFSVVAVDATTLRFSVQRQPIEREDFSIPAELGEPVVVDVDVSVTPLLLSFAAPDLLTPAADVGAWPLQPPVAGRYDIVVEGDASSGLQLLLSPAAAAVHIP